MGQEQQSAAETTLKLQQQMDRVMSEGKEIKSRKEVNHPIDHYAYDRVVFLFINGEGSGKASQLYRLQLERLGLLDGQEVQVLDIDLKPQESSQAVLRKIEELVLPEDGSKVFLHAYCAG